MKAWSLLSTAGLSLALLPVVTGVTSPPRAEAVVPSDLAVVSHQDNGCAVKDSVTLANPLTGAKVSEPGKPVSTWAILNEAKPFDLNRKIVALWAGSSTSGAPGGVGVYDRTTSAWTTSFALPATVAKGAAHSIVRLPGDYYAVAHAGTVTGQSGSGFVLLFNSSGTLVSTYPLASAHGVEWDESRRKLFATGFDYIRSYDFPGDRLVPGAQWTLPGTRNGHDIRRRRTDTKFLVSGNDAAWVFDPDAAAGSEFTTLTKTGGAALGSGVKTLDQGFDGKVMYGYWKVDDFFFTDQNPVQAGFCMSPYKFRWIFATGTPVFQEDTAPPPPAPVTQPAEPFLWAQKRVTTSAMTPIHDMWLGAATNTTADSAYSIVRDSAWTKGEVPFIKFYYFGDDGAPSMNSFMSATSDQITAWENYAYKIATALGDKPGYVVMEPEYDIPKDANGQLVACNAKFEAPMTRIVDMFHRTAPNAVLINQSSFYAGTADPYKCYADVAAKMDAQGFLIHIVNTSDFCTLKTDGTHFPYGETLTSALQIVKKVRDKAALTHTAFGADHTFLSDLAVTSCDWDGSHTADGAHQAQIFDNLADALPTLYQEVGLRGAVIRTGGPSREQRAMGIENEGDFVWSSASATRINAAYTEMQNYLTSISGTTPTFDASATATSPVGPSQSVPIDVTVTNTGGSLTNGNIKVEVQGSGGTIVGQTSFSNASFSTGQSLTKSWTWTGTATPGTYGVHVGVFSQDWATQYAWKSNVAWITVNSAGEPAFTSTASASPGSIAPGGSSTVSATVTNTGTTLSGGEVAIEVYDPNGQLAYRDLTTGQTISGGASATYSTTFTAPASGAGSYPVAVVVTGAGGTPVYHSHDAATSVVVGPDRFASSATVDKAMVLPGATATFSVNVTNGGATVSGATVSLEAYDSTGALAGSQTSPNQTLLGSGASTSYTWAWPTPATKDAYTLHVVVTDSAGSTLHANASASSVTVGSAKLTSTVDTSPSTVAPGGTVTFTNTVTNVGAALDNAIVALDIYNSAGTKVGQVPTNGLTGQSINHGQVKTYTWTWTAPTTTGTYTVKSGVWSAGWSTTYHYNNTADTFAVANPSFTSTAVVSPSNVAVGGTATITATVTNTGGALVNGIVRIDVYDSAGVAHNGTANLAQSIANGESKSYTQSFTPTATGTYTVKVGVWNSTWGTTYHYNNNAATISAGSTFQPNFTIGDGANTWWIEVYTASDVTGVDVIGKDGQFYLSLTKKSWGAWAATAPSELTSGSLVRFIARRSSDGATAGSNNFAWLSAQPATDPGWVATLTKGSGANTSFVEVAVSPTASSVEVKAGTGAFTALTYSSTSGKWGKAMSVPTGTKVVFRAFDASGRKAYSTIMTW